MLGWLDKFNVFNFHGDSLYNVIYKYKIKEDVTTFNHLLVSIELAQYK